MSQTITASRLSDEQRRQIRQAYDANRNQMTIVLARQLGVPEADVLEAMTPDLAVELDATRWEELLRSFESIGNVHVVASNASTTLEAFGQFGNFSTWGDYFNVQTKSLDMHIRGKTLTRVFAVEKPSHMDGVSTLSFQFFNGQGEAAFKVFLTFGGKPVEPEKRAAFDKLRQQFAR